MRNSELGNGQIGVTHQKCETEIYLSSKTSKLGFVRGDLI